MNDKMWANPSVQANCATLASQGKHILEPGVGPLASPDEGAGQGRMQEPETILAHCARLLTPASKLTGKRVVITAGPTREPIDPVRYLSNHSTGKQGTALAEAAWRRGADVVMVHGHMSAPVPVGVQAKPVETTQDMAEAVASEIGSADVLIMAAAPADFRPAQVFSAKMKKSGSAPSLALTETPDVLKSTASRRKAGMIVVGFALETDDLETNAQKKLADKGLDFVVANSAREAGAGFGYDTNRVTIVARNSEPEALPLMSKRETAEAILDRVEAML
jgi:phosphopantothenoylcysteine decarboxylase/phosphopantothenate--cysteine ligase